MQQRQQQRPHNNEHIGKRTKRGKPTQADGIMHTHTRTIAAQMCMCVFIQMQGKIAFAMLQQPLFSIYCLWLGTSMYIVLSYYGGYAFVIAVVAQQRCVLSPQRQWCAI